MAVQCYNRLGGATIVLLVGCPNGVPTVLGFTACFCQSMHQLDNEQNKDFLKLSL